MLNGMRWKSRRERRAARKGSQIDAALNDTLRSAAEAADSLLALAPADRCITADELCSIDAFLFQTLMPRLKERWVRDGMSLEAVELFAKPFEARVREAFRSRLHEKAPLHHMVVEGAA